MHRAASTKPIIPQWRPPELKGSGEGWASVQKDHLDHLPDSLWSPVPRAPGREVGVSSAPKKDGVSSGHCLALKLHGPRTGQEYSQGQTFAQNTVLQHDWLFNLRTGQMAQARVPPPSALSFAPLCLIPSPTSTEGSGRG